MLSVSVEVDIGKEAGTNPFAAEGNPSGLRGLCRIFYYKADV
jgi:hypothetical protein